MSSVVCRQFSLGEIEDATKNFEKILGHGGEGTVYLGQISAIGSVAVKRLKSNLIEFEKEIDLVSKIRHPNLVFLHGYCEESSQKILVYEYMGKGSLSDYISKKTTSTICLSWQKRLNICLGAARGLQHLHKETEIFTKGIIHRDIKPDNILLDDNWVAKVSDFGLCKLSRVDQLKSTMISVLKGTGGYYAPEYIKYGSLTRKVDVYAFGVVLFQVLCCKMPWDRGDESYYRMEDEDLGLWALENVDPEIIEEISEDCLEVYTQIIARCLQLDPSIRPTMEEVVMDLECVLKCQDSQHEGTRPKPPNRGRKVLIPGSAQKMIEKIKETNIKEITETNENEIYAMLKECSMDPVKTIQKLVMRGVETAEPDLKSSLVTVKGTFGATNLVDYVNKRTGKHAVIVKQDPPPPEEKKEEEDKGKDGKDEKKGEEGGDKKDEKKEGGDEKNEEGSGDDGAAKPAAGDQEDGKVVELRKNEFYYYPPPSYSYPAHEMFSDENPNACSIM